MPHAEADAMEIRSAIDFLRDRMRTQFAKLWEREGFAVGLLRHLRTRSPQPLLFSPARLAELAARARALDPDGAAAEREIADHAVAGRLLAATNPACRRFVEIDRERFDFSSYDHADPQALHGLNRQPWTRALARAHRETRDPRYYAALLREWDYHAARVPAPDESLLGRIHERFDGALHRPPYHELDNSIRLTNWYWAFWLSLFADEMTPERCAVLLARALRLFDLVAAWGIGDLAQNHTTMQTEALYLWSAALPEVAGMATWKHFARCQFEVGICAAVFPDGVQFEVSPSYHLGCISWFGLSCLLARRIGEPWPAGYENTLRGMARFTDAVATPDGGTPPVSDSDRPDDGRPALALLRCLFPDLMFSRPVAPTYSSLWASDGLTWDPSLSIAPAPPTIVFPHGGVAVARSPGGARASYLLVDNGPNTAWHAHADNLAVLFEAFGKPVLVDPGRWLYDSSDDRVWVTAAEAHNTLTIEDTPVPAGTRIARHSHAAIPAPGDARLAPLDAREEDGVACITTAFAGFADDPGATVTRRAAMSLDPANPWLLVIDQLSGPRPHVWTNSWLVPTATALEPLEAGWRVRLDCGLWVHVAATADVGLTMRDDSRFHSPTYGTKEPARWLRFSAPQTRGVRAFLFVPGDGPSPRTGRIEMAPEACLITIAGRKRQIPVPAPLPCPPATRKPMF